MRAILFDIDGTLLLPNGGILHSLNRLLAEYGAEPIANPPIGLGLREILAARLPDTSIEPATMRFREIFLAEGLPMANAVPRIQEFVAGLRARAPVGVVTSKGQEEAERTLEFIGVSADVVVGDDDVRPVKPDPAPLLHAANLLGVAPRDCIYVGDTRVDAQAAASAGMRCLIVAWGHGDAELLAGANVVRELEALESELRNFLANPGGSASLPE